MQYRFSYNKQRVIQALRYHFITRPEIRGLIIVINVFAILSGVLFYFRKIQPQPFLVSSFLWFLLMITFFWGLPYFIYKKSTTFKDRFLAVFHDNYLHLETEKGAVDWQWTSFSSYFESSGFFHLYINSRSFFLLPKDQMPEGMENEVRNLLNRHIKRVKLK